MASDASAGLRTAIRNLEATRCADRRCCATELTRLGAESTPLRWVVALESERECLFGQRQAEAPAQSSAPPPNDGDSDTEANAARPSCAEYWLLKGSEPPRALDSACDDEKWEGHFELDARNEQLTYYGSSLYSNPRTHEERVLGLNPVRWLETRYSTQDLGMAREEHWSWERFAGELTLGIALCAPPPGATSAAAASVALDSDSPPIEVRAIKIPRLALAPAVLSGWRTTSIEPCAARVDGEAGFVLSRGQGSPSSSSFSAAFVGPDVLLLEIHDDHFVGGESRTAVRDELELVTASANTTCADPRSQSKIRRLRVGALDGTLRIGAREKSRPVVEVARIDGGVRLKLTFEPPAPSERLTIVYRDTDDGRTFRRVLATSEFEESKWWTLGEVPSPTESLSCELDSGALRPLGAEAE